MPTRFPALFATGFILVSGCLVALALLHLRTQAIESGERLTESFARVIEEQTTRTFQTIDQRLQLAASGLAQLDASTKLNEQSARALMREALKELPFVRAMWVLDAQGRIKYDSDIGNIGLNLSDRAYFQIYQTQPQTGFHIGAPVRSRSTGAWLISAARPLGSASETFSGIIVAAVEPTYFDKLWRTIDLGAEGSIALFRRDGVLMTRSPIDDAVIGKDFHDGALFSVHLPKNSAASFQDISPIDGVSRLFAYRTLPAQPELLVVVGKSYELMLAPWKLLAALGLSIWAAASATILILCLVLTRAWQQRIRTEARAQQLAQQLTLATDAATIGIWDWDLVTDQWYASPTYFTMLGYKPENSPGHRERWLERIHPEDRDSVAEKMRGAPTAAEDSYQYETRMRHADGSYRWVNVVGRVIARDENGKARRMMGVRIDITERKQVEEERRHSHERFQIVARATNDAVWDWDLTSNTLWWNDGYRTLFGYSPEEADPTAASWTDFIHPEDLDRVVHGIHEVIDRGGNGWSAEYRFRRHDGSYAKIFDRGMVTHDAQGKSVRMIGAMQDITSHKLAEEQLRGSEENLAITLQSIGDAVIATDIAGLITRMNATAERLTGWLLAEAIGQPLSEVFRMVSAETRLPLINPAQRVIEGGEMVGLADHTVLLARDGCEYHISDSAAPIRGPSGQIAGVVMVFRDVTEDYRMRQILASTTEMLERTGEIARVGGWELDLRTMKLFWSRQTCRIHEVDPPMAPDLEEGINLFVPEARPIVRAAMQAAIDSGTPYDLELQKITAKGRLIWVRAQGFAVRENGITIKLLGAFHDISERKQSEAMLKESEQRFRTIFETEPECVKVLGLKGELVEMNASGLAMLEVESVVQARSHGLIKFILPQYRAGFIALHQRVMGGNSGMLEFEINGLRGARRWLETHASPMRDPEGCVTMMLAVTRDITDRKHAQSAIEESEQRYRALVEWSPEAIAVHRDGQLIFINPAAIKIFGATNGNDLVGKSMLELVHPDFHEIVLARMKNIIDGVDTPMIALKYLRVDGTPIDVEVQSTSIIFDGAPAIHVAIRDITERRQAGLALEAAHQRTGVLAQLGRELAEAATPKAAAIHILDAAQQLLRWDSGWLHLSDEQQRNRMDLVNFDLIDGEIREVFPDMSATQSPTRIARLVKEQGPQLILRDAEAVARADAPTFGSHRRSLSLMFVPIRLAGRFIGILSIQSYQRHAYDPADLELLQSLATHCAGALVRLRSADALRESEDRYRALAEWSPQAIGVQRGGKTLYVNPAAIRMFGATCAQDLIGKPILDLTHPDSRQVLLERMKKVTIHDEVLPLIEEKFLKVDGTVFDAEVQSISIIYDGEPAVFIAARDITERKQAEAARASLEAQLRESQKMEAIGTLAGGIAHDFNNIIATILGNTELALEDLMGTNPVALESLEEIRKAGSRARDLVQQILSFSRRQPTERKVVALPPVVAESVRLLRATLPSRLSLEVHIDAEVPRVLANATQIEQIVINLVTNAMQAIQGSRGRIGIRLDTVMLDTAMAMALPALAPLHARQPGRTVQLAVSDNGPGMDAATCARIFEPFFTTKGVDEGTGLGLSVVHGIVQTHEGAVLVDSQPGTGTTFTIYLPISLANPDTPEPDSGPVAAPTATICPPHAVSNQHILYLDDDESLVFLITRQIERRGFRISGFINQRAALDALRANPDAFDLVVTDYNMPGMSGLDVARAVRAIRADLPVAITSGFIDDVLRTQAASAGVQQLIFKVSAVDALGEALAKLAQQVSRKSPRS